jgi:hypothetical protein
MVNAMNKGSKEGGVIKMASGGIASGLNDYELRDMSKRLGDKQLGDKLNNPETDPDTKDILGGEMARRSQTRRAAGVGMASGGILAFKDEGLVDNEFAKAKYEKDAPVESKFIDVKKEEKKAEKKPVTKVSSGITGESDEFKRQMREIGPALEERKKINPYEQTLIDALKTEDPSKKTPQSYLEEQQEIYRAAGVDPNFFEKAKTPLTKRMTELDASAENKKRMREAQAWAVFGSTPGPMLSSAMKAYSGYLEQTITDEEDLAKAKSELNKAIFDIDKASYLEKIGDAKDARKFKYDGFDRFAKLSYEVADLAGKRSGDVLKATAGASETAAKGRNELKVAYARNAGTGGGGKREDNQTIKYQDALRKWNDSEKGKELARAEGMLAMPKLEGDAKVMAEKTVARLRAERDALKAELDVAFPLARTSGEGKKPEDKAAPTGVKFLGFEK